MDLKTLDDLYRYNRWANSRVLDTAVTLGREEFVSTIPSSFPSLRDTLVHVLWAEWLWLQRWKGLSPRTMFVPGDYADAGAIRSRWTELQAEQAGFLRTLDEGALSRDVRYVNLRGETWEYALWKQMLHVVNHSTYHRGQAVTMLRHLGRTPPATDLLVFYDEGGR